MNAADQRHIRERAEDRGEYCRLPSTSCSAQLQAQLHGISIN